MIQKLWLQPMSNHYSPLQQDTEDNDGRNENKGSVTHRRYRMIDTVSYKPRSLVVIRNANE